MKISHKTSTGIRNLLDEGGNSKFQYTASTEGAGHLNGFVSWADSSLAHERKYCSAGSGPVAMRVDRVLFYLLGDHLGSISLTTHANGQVHSEMKYMPYGKMRLVNGRSPTDIGYVCLG